jgi:hypothetical protein
MREEEGRERDTHLVAEGVGGLLDKRTESRQIFGLRLLETERLELRGHRLEERGFMGLLPIGVHHLGGARDQLDLPRQN